MLAYVRKFTYLSAEKITLFGGKKEIYYKSSYLSTC